MNELNKRKDKVIKRIEEEEKDVDLINEVKRKR